ncbi:MAG: cytochrome c5 family protein [Methylophaga sp.]|nr:cytochrome c5 family protein [Methylophaga sp.]
MASQNTGKFFVGSIIIFIIVFGLVNVILSTMLSVAKGTVTPESMANEDVVERIKPVAKINIGEPPVVEVAVVAVAAPTAAGSSDDAGAKIVKSTCALCHRTGMMSSPKLGDADGWAPRIEQGVDKLYANAINGFNMMPARGGNPDLSDDDVKAAVDHMISLTK